MAHFHSYLSHYPRVNLRLLLPSPIKTLGTFPRPREVRWWQHRRFIHCQLSFAQSPLFVALSLGVFLIPKESLGVLQPISTSVAKVALSLLQLRPLAQSTSVLFCCKSGTFSGFFVKSFHHFIQLHRHRLSACMEHSHNHGFTSIKSISPKSLHPFLRFLKSMAPISGT